MRRRSDEVDNSCRWPFGPGSGSEKIAMVDPATLTGSQPNRLVGFDPKIEKFFGLTPIPSG
ncbi:MAG: hypothetical protein ABI037_10770 [Gemmatimonadales bacterium]